MRAEEGAYSPLDYPDSAAKRGRVGTAVAGPDPNHATMQYVAPYGASGPASARRTLPPRMPSIDVWE